MFGVLGAVLLAGLWAGPVTGQPAYRSQPASEGALPLAEALARVDSLRSVGHFRRALSSLKELKAAHPNRVEILYRQAFIRSELGKTVADQDRTLRLHRKAVAVAAAAVEADPESAWAHLAVAVAQGRLTQHVSTRERVKRSRLVKRHVDRAIALDSTLAPAYHVRARWNQIAADISLLARAVVQVVYGGLPEASYEKAVADSKRAIEIQTRTYHHLALGKTYMKMGRIDAARIQWRKTLEVPPVDPFAEEFKAAARRLLKEHQ